MNRLRRTTIAFFLEASRDDSKAPRISPLTAEIAGRLRNQDVRVDLIVPKSEKIVADEIWPFYDLYVLKESTPLNLSLARVLALAGAKIVNGVRPCLLARDKIAATALIAAAGVPVPPSWASGRMKSLQHAFTDGPIWLKPRSGTNGNGVLRLTQREGLDLEDTPADPHGLPLPVFAQGHVPSSGSDLKVYVVGSKVWAISRPFRAETVAQKIGKPAPLKAEMRDAALVCGEALGLEIYGVDFLLSANQFYVIDVNAFPGFKGIAEAPAALAEYLYLKASRQCDAEIHNTVI